MPWLTSNPHNNQVGIPGRQRYTWDFDEVTSLALRLNCFCIHTTPIYFCTVRIRYSLLAFFFNAEEWYTAVQCETINFILIFLHVSAHECINYELVCSEFYFKTVIQNFPSENVNCFNWGYSRFPSNLPTASFAQ